MKFAFPFPITFTLALIAATFLSGCRRTSEPNLFILQSCCMRPDHLEPWGYPLDTAPALTRFSRNSIVFLNYIGHSSFETILPYLRKRFLSDPELRTRMLAIAGVPTDEINGKIPEDLWRPAVSRFKIHVFDWGPDRRIREGAPRDWQPIPANLRQEPAPRFRMVTSRFMHPPAFPGGSPPFAEFPEPFRERLRELLQLRKTGKPSSRSNPLSTWLFEPDPAARAWTGLFDSTSLKKWTASPHFQTDLQIMSAVHDWKIRQFDSRIAVVLDTLSAPPRENDTLSIFMGNHGTSLGEHGRIHNGDVPYDENLRIPLIVKIPGLRKRHLVHEQISPENTADLIADALLGRLTSENAMTRIEQYRAPVIFSVNCAKTSFSLRFQNEWKFIRSESPVSGHRELYDLTRDPGETRNLAVARPEKVAEFEELMIRNGAAIDELTRIPCSNPDLESFNR